jgi:hypothetical protein
MRFKEERLRDEFWKLTSLMRMIVCDADLYAESHGAPLCWTSFIRSEDEQQALYEAGDTTSKVSVHQFGRGADARPTGNSILDDEIRRYISEKYEYDPSRPEKSSCIIHGGTARHLHFQSLT